MEVEVDEDLLRRISERTHGRFFKATDPETLRGIFVEIDELEKTEIVSQHYTRYREAFQPLLWLSLVLLIAPLALATAGLLVEP